MLVTSDLPSSSVTSEVMMMEAAWSTETKCQPWMPTKMVVTTNFEGENGDGVILLLFLWLFLMMVPAHFYRLQRDQRKGASSPLASLVSFRSCDFFIGWIENLIHCEKSTCLRHDYAGISEALQKHPCTSVSLHNFFQTLNIIKLQLKVSSKPKFSFLQQLGVSSVEEDHIAVVISCHTIHITKLEIQ